MDVSGPANVTVEVARPEPHKRDPFDGVADHIERIVYTDEDHKGFTMRLHPQTKHYDAANDFRRPPPAQPGFFERVKHIFTPLGAFPTYEMMSVTNAADLDYFAKLWFGSQNTEIPVNPDTGSQYTTVCGSTATTCLGDKWDHTTSTSYGVVGSSETKEYGSVSLVGFTATDRVCVTTGTSGCSTDNFNIFVITSQTGMTSAYSGIWGLSSGLSNPTPTLLWQALKDNNIITNRIFCFGLRLNTGTSFLDMGSVITSNTKGGTIYYVEAISDFWWTNYVTGVKFGTG